jgi:hypothetical protein
MEPEGSLQLSQELVIDSIPTTDESSPQATTIFLQDSPSYNPPILTAVTSLQISLSILGKNFQ